MDLALLGIPVGIIFLYFGSEWMVDGAKKFALRLGLSPFIIGLTIVAFGSSAPECVTSIVSVDTPDIIIGNIVGSNIANVGLAIGLSALLSPLVCKFEAVRFELITTIVSVVAIQVLCLFGVISFVSGLVLVIALFAFVFLVYMLKKDDPVVEEIADDGKRPMWLLVCMIIVGLVMLYYGARYFIDGAVILAGMLGVSDLLIGLLVVAVGTSLPELCICLMAAYRNEDDIVVSNILGSVIFNSFFALGVGALLVDIPISDAMLVFHAPMMVLMAVVLSLMIWRKDSVSRPMGVLLLALYVAYIAAMAIDPSLTI